MKIKYKVKEGSSQLQTILSLINPSTTGFGVVILNEDKSSMSNSTWFVFNSDHIGFLGESEELQKAVFMYLFNEFPKNVHENNKYARENHSVKERMLKIHKYLNLPATHTIPLTPIEIIDKLKEIKQMLDENKI